MTDKVQFKAEIEKVKLIILSNRAQGAFSEGYLIGQESVLEHFENFVNSMQEEPVSEDLEEAAQDELDNQNPNWVIDESGSDYEYPEDAYNEFQMKNMFKAGAKWQKEQFEKNRLKHCSNITNEQAELEQGFIDQHLDKNQRMPTFLDAIEYGMRLQKEQMMKDVMPCVLEWYDGFVLNFTEKQLNDVVTKNNINIGDKVKLIVIKE